MPQVIGIDDWAFRKAVNYGTIIVDLKTHRPVDLLSDQQADTVRDWLL
jgi:transposase